MKGVREAGYAAEVAMRCDTHAPPMSGAPSLRHLVSTRTHEQSTSNPKNNVKDMKTVVGLANSCNNFLTKFKLNYILEKLAGLLLVEFYM